MKRIEALPRPFKIGFGAVVIARNQSGDFLLLRPDPDDNKGKLESVVDMRSLLTGRKTNMLSFENSFQLPGGKVEARHFISAGCNPFTVGAITAAKELAEESQLNASSDWFTRFDPLRLVLQKRPSGLYLFIVATYLWDMTLVNKEQVFDNDKGYVIKPENWSEVREKTVIRPRDLPIINSYVKDFLASEM